MNEKARREKFEDFLNDCQDRIKEAKKEKNPRKVKLYKALAKHLEMMIRFYTSKGKN